MSPSPPSEPQGPKAPTPYWSTAYVVVVAVLYLWGYWSPFNINVLEYLSLADVVKAAAYPLASVFFFAAVGALAGEAMFPEGFLPSGGGANTKAGVWLGKAAPVIVTVYVIAIVMYLIFGSVEKWRFLPILIAIPVCFALKEAGLMKTLLNSDRARTVVLFLLAALPPFAYGEGTLKAHRVMTGTDYTYVASEIAGHPFDDKSKAETRLRYVGKAGDQYFLYAPGKRSVLVVPIAEAKVFEVVGMESALAKAPITPPSAPSKARASAAPSP
jgi:hypothetical protein